MISRKAWSIEMKRLHQLKALNPSYVVEAQGYGHCLYFACLKRRKIKIDKGLFDYIKQHKLFSIKQLHINKIK